MQDYPVIGRVLVMSVSVPITRFDMKFYISFYYSSIGSNNRIPKISTPVIIDSSRVDYLKRFTFFCGQLCAIQQQVLPNFSN